MIVEVPRSSETIPAQRSAFRGHPGELRRPAIEGSKQSAAVGAENLPGARENFCEVSRLHSPGLPWRRAESLRCHVYFGSGQFIFREETVAPVKGIAGGRRIQANTGFL